VYVKRKIASYLDLWMMDDDRKPLVLRGARQVGKTWLVRDLAQRHGRMLVELNMERRPELADYFRTNDPRRAISDLSADLGMPITSATCLLFIDEVQATPQLLAFLRWFREDMPDMPVVAAGSLLDFALRDHAFSMPVGRISYCYLEPVSFYEFLDASSNEMLKSALVAAGESLDLSPRLHQRALELFAEYCLVGGLPEVVSDWVAKRDDARRLQLQRDLLATYRDDFNKYRGRISADQLRGVMDAIPRQLAGRFVYSHVDAEARHRDIKQALELLRLARVCHCVEHTSANGLPLGAETNPRTFKMILVDVGLAAVQLGLSRLDFGDINAPDWVNKGGIAEQFVGQHLRCLAQAYEDPRLFYWQRTEGRMGEVDYIIQHHSRVIPVEVKAGKAGTMKSLHAFMYGKHLDFALRLDANAPSRQDLVVKTTTGDPVNYRLVSLPLYMAESIPVVIESR
jgi:uncharacterized protein